MVNTRTFGPLAPKRSSRISLVHQGLAAFLAASLGGASLRLLPALQLEFFAAGAAQLVSLFTGQPVVRTDNGWMLPDAGLTMVVTAACSATDFFLMVGMIVAWRLAGKRWSVAHSAIAGIISAIPLSIFLNSLRIVVVGQVHRWITPQLAESYGPFLHMATGVAIFLPSLIALNGLLNLHSAPRSTVSS